MKIKIEVTTKFYSLIVPHLAICLCSFPAAHNILVFCWLKIIVQLPTYSILIFISFSPGNVFIYGSA